MNKNKYNHGVLLSCGQLRVSRRKNEIHIRNSVYSVVILLLLFALLSCDGAPELEEEAATWEEARPLKEIYQSYFLMGNIISPSDLNNNATAATRFGYLKRHYNTLTAENHMKPDNIAPRNKPATDTWTYQWTNADNIVNAARDAGMNVVGHTLIWHSQTPAWLTTGTPAEVEANLNKYVTEVVTHFKGKVIAWDVVNEAMKDGLTSGDSSGDKWTNCLRGSETSNGSRWNAAIGSEYIEKAFLAARRADPDVKLYYNDYSLNTTAKRMAVYNMVKAINTKYPNVEGRPLIDGIGMQSHHHRGTDPQTVDASIKKFAELGVEIAISELDILTTGSLVTPAPAWNEDDIKYQAGRYALMFQVFKNNAANISRVTFWGIDDATSWRKNYYPTLLDKDYNLKPAFYAVTNPDRYLP